MSAPPRPPRVPRVLVSLLLRGEMREVVLGDLDEEFARAHADGRPRRAATRRYWRQALASLAQVARRIDSGPSAASHADGQDPRGLGGLVDGWRLDIRHAVRALARAPGFTTIGVLSLALGIAANVTMFGVIRALLFETMAVRAPDELSLVYWSQPGALDVTTYNSSGHRDPATGLVARSNVSYPTYEELRRSAPDGITLAGFNFLRDVVVQNAGQLPVQAGGLIVDGRFFSVIDPPMAMGRALQEADDVEGGTLGAVLSYRFWMRAFGGDRTVLDRPIRVNGHPAVVIGVTAPQFRGLTRGGFFPATDITLPLRAAPLLQPEWNVSGQSILTSPRQHWVRLIARSRPDADRAAAARVFASAIERHAAPFVRDRNSRTQVHFLPGARGLDQTGDDTRRLLYVLAGVVGLVLLIACVNLATMMLARGVARQREIAVRRALGAGRARVIRGMVAEGALIALAGASAGLLLVSWSRSSVTTMLIAGLGSSGLSMQPIEISIDVWLVAGAFGLSLLAVLVFGLFPALRLTRGSRVGDLQHHVIGAPAPKLGLGRLLVALQIAASVPLFVGALLFLRTLANLTSVDLGFNPDDVALFRLDPGKVASTLTEQAAIYEELLTRLAGIPGIASASLMENALLSGITSNTGVQVNGTESSIAVNAVGPAFIETMGMRLLAGRAPGAQDRPGSPDVVMLNETAAKTLFGSTAPIGQVITSGGRRFEVIGVVNDSVYSSRRDPIRPTVYPSALQRPGYGGHYVVLRTNLPLEALDRQVRDAIASVRRDLPIPDIRTQAMHVEASTMRERVFTRALMLFGGFALLLVCIGLYGVTSYSVERRTGEIGIRIALGARREQVLWLVYRQVLLLSALGLAVGVPLAVLAVPVVRALLFGVAPADYAVIAVVAGGVMMLVAVAAGLLPARRAASLNPIEALRSE